MINISPSGWRGRDLILLREMLGWSQAQLAHALGLAGATSISFWENDPRAATKYLSEDKAQRLEEIAHQHDIRIVRTEELRGPSQTLRRGAGERPGVGAAYDPFAANAATAALDIDVSIGAMNGNASAIAETLSRHAPDRDSGVALLLLFSAEGHLVAHSAGPNSEDQDVIERLRREHLTGDFIRVITARGMDCNISEFPNEVILVRRVDRRGVLWLLARIGGNGIYLPGLVKERLDAALRALAPLVGSRRTA